MWHVSFGKHSLVAGIFYCLVVFNPLFWQALPSTAILVQGGSVVALLCCVFCFPALPCLKQCMFWAQGSIPLSCWLTESLLWYSSELAYIITLGGFQQQTDGFGALISGRGFSITGQRACDTEICWQYCCTSSCTVVICYRSQFIYWGGAKLAECWAGSSCAIQHSTVDAYRCLEPADQCEQTQMWCSPKQGPAGVPRVPCELPWTWLSPMPGIHCWFMLSPSLVSRWGLSWVQQSPEKSDCFPDLHPHLCTPISFHCPSPGVASSGFVWPGIFGVSPSVFL